MKKILIVLLAGLMTVSCGIQPVVPNGVSDVKFEKIDMLKGLVVMDMGLRINNPNGFSITVHGMELNIGIAGVPLGSVTVDQKFKIQKKKEDVYRVHVNANLTDVISGIPKLLAAISRKETNAEVNGWIRVGAFGLKKKFPVNIKQEKVQTSEEKK